MDKKTLKYIILVIIALIFPIAIKMDMSIPSLEDTGYGLILGAISGPITLIYGSYLLLNNKYGRILNIIGIILLSINLPSIMLIFVFMFFLGGAN